MLCIIHALAALGLVFSRGCTCVSSANYCLGSDNYEITLIALQALPLHAEATAGSVSAHSNSFMTRVTYTRLTAARTDPELAVQLSAHIPELLELTAGKSAKLLTKYSSVGSSSGSGSSTSEPGVGRGASSPRVTVATHDKLGTWQQLAQNCSAAVTALFTTTRLPAQQVLEQFACPAAGELCTDTGAMQHGSTKPASHTLCHLGW